MARQATRKAGEILTIDRLLDHKTTIPGLKGMVMRLFVRERVLKSLDDAPAPRKFKGKAVLMVHGGFWPSTGPFDLSYKDYSWMAALAAAGYDVWALDMTGYGRSSRPKMDDPHNLPPEDQKELIPHTLKKVGKPSYPYILTTTDSDADDIDRVVDYIRAYRGIDKVSLIGWSGGGFRIGTYTVRHPEKVDKLVIFASSTYDRKAPDGPPAKLPERGYPMRFQSRYVGETLRWDSKVGCPDQVAPGLKDIIWSGTAQSDPVGAEWGPGGLRAPTRTTYGWNKKAAGKITHPTLIMIGEFDRLTARNLQIYGDLAAKKKVFVQIACASHFLPWEKNRHVLHKGAIEWLSKGSFNGKHTGTFRAESASDIKPKVFSEKTIAQAQQAEERDRQAVERLTKAR
jgi:pimeloyl-ACP methyl ester carboxylesterase